MPKVRNMKIMHRIKVVSISCNKMLRDSETPIFEDAPMQPEILGKLKYKNHVHNVLSGKNLLHNVLSD